MKYFLTLISLLLITQICEAKCGGGIAVYPEGNTINVKGHIIIEAYGWGKSHELLNQLGDKHRIYLLSEKDEIDLIQRDYKKGEKSWSQVLLTPKRELTLGLEYVLVAEIKHPDDELYLNLRRMPRRGGMDRARWTVVKSSTENKSSDPIEATLKTSNVQKFGCGPAVENRYTTNDEINNDQFILTQILEIESGKLSEYYIIKKNDELKIGHGMCSGPYKFKRNNSYKIRFSADYVNEISEEINWVSCPNPWENEEKY